MLDPARRMQYLERMLHTEFEFEKTLLVKPKCCRNDPLLCCHETVLCPGLSTPILLHLARLHFRRRMQAVCIECLCRRCLQSREFHVITCIGDYPDYKQIQK